MLFPKNLTIETLLPAQQQEEHSELEHQDLYSGEGELGRIRNRRVITSHKRTF